MAMEFAGLSLATLTEMKNDAYSDYKKAKKEKKDDEMKTALAEMKQFDALIEKKQEEKPAPIQTNTDYSKHSQLQSTFRTIDGCVDKIPVFSPGMEVHSFLRQVGTASFLAGDDPLAVKHLIKQLVTRLCPEYAQIYCTHVETTPINTVDQFKRFFSSTFESKKSVFQVMQETENWTRKPTESHRDYANRVSQELFDLTGIVKAKWKEAKKQEKSSFDKEMEADDVFRLIGGMVLLRDVAQDRAMFNHVITRIDSATDASGIASVVMAYFDRKQTTDLVLSNVGEVNLADGRNRDKLGNDNICTTWKETGECKRFERNWCTWMHPIRFRKKKTGQSQNGQGQGGRNRQGQGGNRQDRGQGGWKPTNNRKPSANSRQSAPRQANHVDAELEFENQPFIDAFAGAGFQH